MKKISYNYLLFMLIFIIFIFEVEARQNIQPFLPSGEIVKGKNWLFVIGIKNYIKAPVLKTPINNAKAVKKVLIEKYHFDQEHLVELYDSQATKKDILEKLYVLSNKIKNEDSLLIFYSGHGHADIITKTGYWIPVESDINEASTWISIHEIIKYLKMNVNKVKHVLIISDSYFKSEFINNNFGEKQYPTEEIIEKYYKNPSSQILYSGKLTEIDELSFNDLSIFSFFLIKLLNNNEKPYLIPSFFLSNIKGDVILNSKHIPELGYIKEWKREGEFVFFLRQKSQLENLYSTFNEDRTKKKNLEEELKQNRIDTEKENELLDYYQKQKNEVDNTIDNFKNNFNPKKIKIDNDLDELLSLINKKKVIKERLYEIETIKMKSEKERIVRIKELKSEQKYILGKSISKYNEIISSPFGEEVKLLAWKSLVSPYEEAAYGLKTGDVDGLVLNVVHGSILNSIGMRFSLILPDENKKFYLQTTEVTQGQWKSIMGSNISKFKNCGDNCPVESVSWNDAYDFINKLNKIEKTDKYRLPTEAEWEYACKSENNEDFIDYGWYRKNSERKTHPVGQKKMNQWGLYDMQGNVREWCQDWYDELKIFKGGGYDSYPKEMRCDYRDYYAPNLQYSALGFRVLKEE